MLRHLQPDGVVVFECELGASHSTIHFVASLLNVTVLAPTFTVGEYVGEVLKRREKRRVQIVIDWFFLLFK